MTMNTKALYTLLMAIGGPISVFGAGVANYIGDQVNHTALCALSHNCPDPSRYGVWGAIPGVLLIIVPLIMKIKK
jgi:hypothetical protein